MPLILSIERLERFRGKCAAGDLIIAPKCSVKTTPLIRRQGSERDDRFAAVPASMKLGAVRRDSKSPSVTAAPSSGSAETSDAPLARMLPGRRQEPAPKKEDVKDVEPAPMTVSIPTAIRNRAKAENPNS